MNASKQGGNRPRKSTRAARNTYVTKSGQTIKIHRNLGEKWAAARDARSRRRAERLVGLPKSRVKRMLYRMQPKRLYKYWFSREGGIMALKIFGISVFAGLLLLLGIFAYFRKDLPNLRDISGDKIGGSIRYYDRSGQTLLWEDYDAVKRIPVPDDQINQYVKSATVAVEDKDFFKHGGFDVRGIARAGINDALHHGATQGGSTITQQLVKLNNDWTKDRTITRKVKELILSVELERTYSKQEILAGYLNAAPYGNVQYGVEAASRDYFEKSAKDLTLDEAAFLAAIPKSPSYYSPYGPSYDPAALKGRQEYILDVMTQEHMITDKQRSDAKKVDVIAKVHKPKPKYDAMKAPYFVLTAKEQLEKEYGQQTVNRGGWKVTTTLDLNLQNEAENQVTKGLPQVKRQGGDTAAFVAEDVKTGQMVALVGGPDFFAKDNNWHENNYARIPIPPGSSFKPYDYSALIDTSDNVGAGSVLYDSQGPVPGYPCTNKALPERGGNCIWDFSRTYPGPLTLRYAIGGSRNVPAVKAMAIVGVDKTIGVAEKMMTSPGDVPGALSSEGRGEYNCYTDEANTKKGPCFNASAIGDGAFLKLDEHVHGYATLSRNGNNVPQTYILKIQSGDGKTVDEWKPTKGVQTIRPDSAYIVSDMISDPNASYFPAGNKPQRYTNSQGTWKFSVKTGTTNDAKDGLMGGFSTQYAAFVWVGYHTRQKAMSGSMENMTAPIWSGWMRAAHKNLKPEDRAKPAGVQTLPAFIVRSNPGYGAVVPSSSTDLFPSWYKGSKSKTGSNRTIDIVSNKGATDCTPARARKDINDAVANSFSVDKFVGAGANADTTQQDDVHKCDDIKPGVSNVTATPSAGGFTIAASITQGTHPLSSDQYPGTVTFSVNGQIIPGGSISISNSGIVTAHCDDNVCGGKTVTVTVVDSVLYDASDIVTVPGGGGGGNNSSPLVLNKPTKSGNTISFTWSGGTGPYDVYYGAIPVPGCTNKTGNGCGPVTFPGNGTYTVKDNANNSSSQTYP